MTGRAARVVRIILGERPVAILFFVVPTGIAILLDVILRGRAFLVFPPLEWLNYFGSSLASAGFWGGRCCGSRRASSRSRPWPILRSRSFEVASTISFALPA